jgi:uncharacterized protein (DUF362 family)
MKKHLVSIVSYEKPLDSVRKAVDLCKGLDHLPSKAKVFIKPNIVWWTSEAVFPKWGVITTSRVVEDMVVILKEHGIDDIIIGEGMVIEPKDIDTPAHAFESLGYNVLKKRYGVQCFNIHKRPFRKVDIGSGHELKFNIDFLESDFLVNIPVLKTHTQTVVSLGIKNIKGLIDIESRKKCHSTDPEMNLHHYVSKLFNQAPPSFTIIDGLYSNEFGPLVFGSNIRRSNTLIASADVLSTDMVGTRILGHEPSQVPHLVQAAQGHGRSIDLSDVELVGDGMEKATHFHAFSHPYVEDKKLFKLLANMGVEGLALPNVDLSLCSYCATLYSNLVFSLLMSWQGAPWDDVEVLAGKIQQPTPGKKKTILFGKCIYDAQKDNPNIQEVIPIKGCPATRESIRKAFAQAGIELSPLFDNLPAALGFLMSVYEGRPEFEESFFTIQE